MTTKVKELSWRPVRRGRVYCSPGCGSECTRASFVACTRRAKALCARLGDGWTPNVSENMGWHYSAVSACGRVKVHANLRSTYKSLDGGEVYSYTAFLGSPGPGGKWAEHGRTPEEAIRATYAVARRDLDKIGAIISDLPRPRWHARTAA
jgi:hypothetical protein